MRIRIRCIVVVFCLSLLACETVDDESLSSENLWGEAGARSYPNAAARMSSRSLGSVPLSPQDREALRPIFPNLVDAVRIHWNSTLLDELASTQAGISVTNGSSEGQTFGYDIYIKGPPTMRTDVDRIRLLIHELVHTQQFVNYGESLEAFGYNYFREYYEAGQIYENNPLEIEAFQRTEALAPQALQRFRSSGVNR